MPRIETNTRTLYQYAELTPKAQARARDWAIAIRREDWDGGDQYEDFETIANILGIDLDPVRRRTTAGKELTPKPAIWYSGFSSQGDGACFEGRYEYKAGSVARLQAYAPTDTELARIVRGLRDVQRRYFYKLRAIVKHTGHYYHEFSTAIEVSANDRHDRDMTIRREDEDELIDLLRAFMKWIYRSLETEYEYQTSDAAAVEMIEGNDYEFTEDGRRPCAC